MSFSFNFELSEEDQETQKEQFSVSDDKKENKVENASFSQPAFEVKAFYDETVISKLDTKAALIEDYEIEIVDTSKLENLMSVDEEFRSAVCQSSSIGDIVSHSDLVNGVYEGGLKIWECAIDLARFVSSPSLDPSIPVARKRVLELGCGAGLPGLCCIKRGATSVDFQDYNDEVLKLLTHTNVENTVDGDNLLSKTTCRYFAGDWGSFCDMNEGQEKYDLILSAETIYNVDNYHKLHAVFDRMLADDGVVLVGAKIYYFGVGGSVDAFVDFLNDRKCFVSESVWETQCDVPRKILKLKRQNRNPIKSNT